MRRFLGAVAVSALVLGASTLARAADEKDAKAILDKAIKALGGEEKLGAAKAITWKAKGKINLGGNESEFTSEATAQGLDHYRSSFEGEFNGNKVKGDGAVNGDKGWRQFGDNKMELDKDGLANEKRNVYLMLVPITLVPLKEKGFKVESAGEEAVGGKPAACLKITAPDGKDFKLYFDKESGLPVKEVAKVAGFMGEEVAQETTYSNYKDFHGIKKATKTETSRDGQKFIEGEVTEFKVLDKVDPKTFAEPQ
jgi:hypothetical protein